VTGPACRLCGAPTATRFTRRVLGRIDVGYHDCAACGLVQTDEPTWLDEAYASAIVDFDTGLLARALYTRRVTAVLLHLAGAGDRPCLDWAGGTGVFTRLMRDAGFEFRWQDPYCANVHARGFEWRPGDAAPFAATAFEVLEHLARPRDGFAALAATGPGLIVTSTRLVPDGGPAPDWDYLAPESGQHVAFYRRATLERLGREAGYPHVIAGPALQLFAKHAAPATAWRLATLPGAPLWPVVRRLRRSLTESDSARLRAGRGAR